MAWWVWAMAGLLLLAAETFVPVDFFVFFLGVAALGVAAITAAGGVATASGQLLWFSILTVGALVGLRRPLLARIRRAGPDHASTSTLVGESAVLLEELAPGAVGKAELRGTTWSARHDGGEALARGRRCRVTRVEGLTLWVRPE
jgi:hypothetical protein